MIGTTATAIIGGISAATALAQTGLGVAGALEGEDGEQIQMGDSTMKRMKRGILRRIQK